MSGKEGTIEKEKVYVKGFIWMMCFLLMVHKTDAKSCSAHVCLTWKTQNSSLVLICKVEVKYALHFPVAIIDPFDNELGYCVPHVPCRTELNQYVIEKTNISDTLDEIVFKIPLKAQLNGFWTCQYGHNNGKAITEVTLQDIDTDYQSSIDCWTLMMLWCVFGFTCTFLPVFVLPFCIKNLENKMSSIARIVCCHGYLCKCCPKLGNYVIVFIFIITLILVPVVVGLIDEQCQGAQYCSCYGAVVGLCCSLLLKEQYSRSEYSEVQHSQNFDSKEQSSQNGDSEGGQFSQNEDSKGGQFSQNEDSKGEQFSQNVNSKGQSSQNVHSEAEQSSHNGDARYECDGIMSISKKIATTSV